MAEGWRQLFEDLGSALGLGNGKRAPSPVITEDQSASSDVSPDTRDPDVSLEVESEQLPPVEIVSPEEMLPSGNEVSDGSSPSSGQKILSFAGLAIALVFAAGFGWYTYFGGPKPPAPDVVATYDGGQITVPQVREHLANLAAGDEVVLHPSYESYRLVVEHMLLNEMVRRWAADQKMDSDARFKDAMRHISESVTLDEWVARLHQGEMQSAVSDSEIQAYYEANRETYANATLAEVGEKIRETLAHQNQEKFFEDYLTRLRAEATIVKEYELLEAPLPTDTQVRDYYRANPERFSSPQRAVVDRIFIPIKEAGEEADNQARAKAEEARAALQARKEVAEVAGEYSQEPYSPQGVTIEAGKGDPGLAEQAFALSKGGDLSPVVRTQDGYYVLRLREQQPARTLSFEEARPQATDAVRAENERAWFEQNVDRTLFTIHGERFTLGQFYHEYQNLPPDLQTQFSGSDGLKGLADLLIDRMLVLDDASNKLVDQENAPLLDEARTAVLRQMMHEAEVDSRVQVSDQDVRDYYEQQKEIFATPPEARIQSIRIALGQTDDESKQAWERAEEAYQKLVPGFGRKPDDFEGVAKSFDESGRNPDTGGLGEWVRMGDDPILDLLAHPLHEYIFALPVGSVSRPFEYGPDIYIVKILERIEPKPLAFEEVEHHIRAELEARQHEQLDAEVASRLLSEARAMIYDQVIQQMLDSERATPAAP